VILLDTNVLSALMRREPDQSVIAWLDAQPAESIWTTSVTVFEVRLGLEVLADGRKRRGLEEAFARALELDLENRIAVFDRWAAEAAARIAAERRRAGRALEIRDVQVAGIATARRAALATRNLRHFEGLSLDLVDPWSSTASLHFSPIPYYASVGT
jgi:predicted nucleic acid-binding protein